MTDIEDLLEAEYQQSDLISGRLALLGALPGVLLLQGALASAAAASLTFHGPRANPGGTVQTLRFILLLIAMDAFGVFLACLIWLKNARFSLCADRVCRRAAFRSKRIALHQVQAVYVWARSRRTDEPDHLVTLATPQESLMIPLTARGLRSLLLSVAQSSPAAVVAREHHLPEGSRLLATLASGEPIENAPDSLHELAAMARIGRKSLAVVLFVTMALASAAPVVVRNVGPGPLDSAKTASNPEAYLAAFLLALVTLGPGLLTCRGLWRRSRLRAVKIDSDYGVSPTGLP